MAGMLTTTLIALALAAPPGFKQTRTTDHCALFLGPADAGVVPMRAECHWPDLTVARLDALMGKVEDHDLYFSSVQVSDLERTEGGKKLVYQVHKAKGISDRQTRLWMTYANSGGVVKVAWSVAHDQPVEVPKGQVAVARSDGFWEFSEHADGGVHAVHQLAYDPGGSVPGFLVRWFQTSGLEAVVTEIEAYAKGG